VWDFPLPLLALFIEKARVRKRVPRAGTFFEPARGRRL
jgi:hypothetical protein